MAKSTHRLNWRRVSTGFVVLLLAVGAVVTFLSNKNPAPSGARVSVLKTSSFGPVLVVGNGTLKGFPLYEFTGDTHGTLGCRTVLKRGYDFDPDGVVRMSCTGPEKDINDGVTSDDWPALTTSAHPVAGAGVDQKLLGSVFRAGIGRQVTYGGHPLYLFDPSSRPFTPAGIDYGETVAPLGPWHGYWFLVSPSDGRPVADRATIEVATLPGGERVIAAKEDPYVNPVAVVVYTDSQDPDNASTCVDQCAAAWVPVLTSGTPIAKDGVAQGSIGTIRRSNGTFQVTYDHHPLYLYSREEFFRSRGPGLLASGTAGNGNGQTFNGATFTDLPAG